MYAMCTQYFLYLPAYVLVSGIIYQLVGILQVKIRETKSAHTTIKPSERVSRYEALCRRLTAATATTTKKSVAATTITRQRIYFMFLPEKLCSNQMRWRWRWRWRVWLGEYVERIFFLVLSFSFCSLYYLCFVAMFEICCFDSRIFISLK